MWWIFIKILKFRIIQDNDWSGRWETPMGVAGRVRPRRLAEEAQLTPHGKRASWNGNQPSFLTMPKYKKESLICDS